MDAQFFSVACKSYQNVGFKPQIMKTREKIPLPTGQNSVTAITPHPP